MIVQKRDGTPDRRILIGCVVDKTVLAAVAQKWEAPGLFGSKWANLVGGWCVAFHQKHGKAPGKAIEAYFEKWAETRSKDADTTALVDTFLASLSGEYARHKKALNPDHLIDLAGERFNAVRLKALCGEIEADLDRGDVTAAEEKRAAFKRVDVGAGAGIDFGLDPTVIDKLYARDAETIVRYKGDIGRMLNPALVRGGFVAMLGGEKSGKSWWLMDIAWRAMLQGKKVAIFEVGDQTEIDMYGRLISRQARAPFKVPKDGRTSYQFPVAMDAGGNLTTDERPFVGNLPKKLAKIAYAKLSEGWGGESRFKISPHPGHSINMTGVRSVLDTWARDGWECDIVLIDYADLLAPLDRKLEKRDQINETWVSMRALTMERHVLLVTATQANRVGYGVEVLTKEHISDDKRKVGHVTALYGINRTAEEKATGMCRINCIDARSFSYNPRRVVYVAGCLEEARPAILSSF